ncbi:gephyrin-like molybdotransferase Glp [uncultured Methylovirgula sp.]|uniref:molybdopterin molybdotransferase MoeA n=1 Tax=uncultured Methylovirgula sp. TaxID=1285960 RepID=UPI00260B5D51|nr:gephyrin-like molybdotransferase Glp [uncultured Methylovirgula sp.]
MNALDLLSVAEARARVLAGSEPRGSERVPLSEALARTLAAPLVAQRTQPPFPASAMDGFALRAADLATLPAQLKVIGESAAGHGFAGLIRRGEAVRIFTGAPVPQGADAVLMQEDATLAGESLTAMRAVVEGRHIRSVGIDFTAGESLLPAGTRLGPVDIALAAASGHAEIAVVRKPRVAILATGDELVQPGEAVGADQIVASNSFAIAAYVRQSGGEPIDLGIASDDFAALEKAVRAARKAEADVLVTLGGASVGKHDLVRSALAKEGMELGFWRIAMRPGKPLIHGRLGDMLILGLPGNPASSVVCALLFLVPLLRALSGDPHAGDDPTEPAVLGRAVPANGQREDYLRAELSRSGDGLPVATPHDLQDSSLLRIFAQSQCLLVRPPHAPAAAAGDLCRIIKLSPAPG